MKCKIKRTRKEIILRLLKGMSPKNCYADYIAAKLNIPAQNVSAILNQCFLQGLVTKQKSPYRKVYYRLKS